MEKNGEYILKRINKYFNNISSDKHNEILGEDSYKFFLLPIDFIDGLLELVKGVEKNFGGMKFLDVGSGVGYICGLAERMGLIAEGIELNPKLFEISTQMFPEIKFYEMNCMDFRNYCNYDIIYYWLPIRNPELQARLKARIEDEIRIGGYIILGEEEKQDTGKDERFIGINCDKFDNKIWKKIRN